MSNLNGTGLRSNIIKHHYQDKASPKERTYASALCGGIAGGSVTKLMGTVSPIESRKHILVACLTKSNRRPAGSGSYHLLITGLLWPERLQPSGRLANGKCTQDIKTSDATNG
jgi:hypothetical protein